MLTRRSYVQKYALWTAFNGTQALLLSPLFFMHPAILARAGLYTAGMMGSIAFVGKLWPVRSAWKIHTLTFYFQVRPQRQTSTST